MYDWLYEFLHSEFAKNYWLVVLISLVLTIYITRKICRKKYKDQLDEAKEQKQRLEDLLHEKENLTQQNQMLQKEVAELKGKLLQVYTSNSKYPIQKASDDPALSGFIMK